VARTYIEKIVREEQLQLQDAEKPLKIVVTQNDIVNAKQLNSRSCAFARAAKKMPGVKGAFFFRTKAYLQYDEKMVRYHLPPSVQFEITSFDRLGVVESGAYNLKPPGINASLIVRRKKTREAAKKARKMEKKSGISQTSSKQAKALAVRSSGRSKPKIHPDYVRSMKEPTE
jgi:hypothetical protein